MEKYEDIFEKGLLILGRLGQIQVVDLSLHFLQSRGQPGYLVRPCLKKPQTKNQQQLGMVAHTFNPSSL